MRLALIIVLFLALAVVAGAQDCGEGCSTSMKRPPSAEVQVCVARNNELYQITLQLGARVAAAEAEVERLKAIIAADKVVEVEPVPEVKTAKPRKVKKAVKSRKGCKPGRWRHPRTGLCGRW